MVKVSKKEGEAPSALLFRFTKRIKQSGVLKESRKRRFTSRKPNKRKARLLASHRAIRRNQIERQRKLGLS